jgi:hypothetical protein
LPAISPLNEARHAQPPPIQCGNHSRYGVFTQPGSKPEKLNESKCFPRSPESGHHMSVYEYTP